MYRQLLTILIASIFILGAVVTVVSATPYQQKWYLLAKDFSYGGTKADDSTGISHKFDIIMSKNGKEDGTSCSLYHDETLWWYAENEAECALGFGKDGDWIAGIYREKGIEDDEIGEILYADVYKVNDTTGETTHLAGGSHTFSEKDDEKYITTITCYDDPATEQDFEEGERFALRLNWTCSTDSLAIYYYKEDKRPYLQSPALDPGYPTSEIPIPEFSTIAIPVVAILGLMFLFHRRKQKN